MSEGVTALFIIWFILSIGIYVLHEVTEYMIWKYIYSILLIVVPFYLFLLPVEEWIPGEAASLEEPLLRAAQLPDSEEETSGGGRTSRSPGLISVQSWNKKKNWLRMRCLCGCWR